MESASEKIANIENQISKEDKITNFILSFKTGLFSFIFGIFGTSINIFKQHGFLEIFTSTTVNIFSLISIFILAFGLISLAHCDKTWGKITPLSKKPYLSSIEKKILKEK